jgi:hypothetical protein
MAKALVDGSVPCSKCGNHMTVENQKFTGGADGEREVYMKCMDPSCRTETFMGIYKKYGNSLVKVS